MRCERGNKKKTGTTDVKAAHLNRLALQKHVARHELGNHRTERPLSRQDNIVWTRQAVDEESGGEGSGSHGRGKRGGVGESATGETDAPGAGGSPQTESINPSRADRATFRRQTVYGTIR